MLGRRWRAIRHERLQVGLAVAAMATAIALPVVLLSVGGGVASHEIAALQSSGFQITVAAAGLHGVADAHALALRIAAIPLVIAASPVLSDAIDAYPSGSGPTPVLAEGIIPSAFAATESPSERGLFPSPLPFIDVHDDGHAVDGSSVGAAGDQVLVSTPLAKEYGVQVGDQLELAAAANGSSRLAFTVAGVFGLPTTTFGAAAAYGIVLGLTNLQHLEAPSGVSGEPAAIPDVADTVLVALDPSAATDTVSIGQVAAQIQALVPYYGVSSLTDEAAQLRSSTTVLTGFYLALSSVALLVGMLFLVLVLLRRVESQRQTVAIQRAVGVPGGQITAQWVTAGVGLSLTGAALGTAGGFILVVALERFGSGAVATAAQLAVFDPVVLLELTAGVVGLGALAGLNAARSALRRPVVEVLR